MATTISVLVDLPETQQYLTATMAALEHSATATNINIDAQLIRTDTITPAFIEHPGDAVVLGPGSPYLRPDLAEEVIRSAREKGIPLVGT